MNDSKHHAGIPKTAFSKAKQEPGWLVFQPMAFYFSPCTSSFQLHWHSHCHAISDGRSLAARHNWMLHMAQWGRNPASAGLTQRTLNQCSTLVAFTEIHWFSFKDASPHSSMHLFHALNQSIPLHYFIPDISRCKLNKICGFPSQLLFRLSITHPMKTCTEIPVPQDPEVDFS